MHNASWHLSQELPNGSESATDSVQWRPWRGATDTDINGRRRGYSRVSVMSQAEIEVLARSAIMFAVLST